MKYKFQFVCRYLHEDEKKKWKIHKQIIPYYDLLSLVKAEAKPKLNWKRSRRFEELLHKLRHAAANTSTRESIPRDVLKRLDLWTAAQLTILLTFQ